MDRLSVDSVSADSWPVIAAGFGDLTFEQTLSYGLAAAARIGAKLDFIAIRQCGRPIAAAAVRTKFVPGFSRGISYVAAGPLVYPMESSAPSRDDINRVLSVLRRHFVDEYGAIFRVRPAAIPTDGACLFDQPARTAGFMPTDRILPYRTVLLDLGQKTDILWSRMKKDWRRRLKGALDSSLELERGTDHQLWTRFERLYGEVRQRKKFSDNIPPKLFQSLKHDDLRCEVLLARSHGEDVAGQIVVITPQVATSMFAATSLRGRELAASQFLDWQCIVDLKRRNIRWLDLGGLDEHANPSVAQYKLRTGGIYACAPGPFEAHDGSFATGLVANIEQLHRLVMRRQ